MKSGNAAFAVGLAVLDPGVAQFVGGTCCRSVAALLYLAVVAVQRECASLFGSCEILSYDYGAVILRVFVTGLKLSWQ